MSQSTTTQIIGTGYITTFPGIYKIIQLTSSFIAVLLIGINFIGSPIRFFESSASISIIISVLLLIFHIFGVLEKVLIPWHRIQFFFQIIFAIYYIIAVAVVLYFGSHYSQIVAGSVFGIIAVIAHISDGLYNYGKHPLC